MEGLCLVYELFSENVCCKCILLLNDGEASKLFIGLIRKYHSLVDLFPVSKMVSFEWVSKQERTVTEIAGSGGLVLVSKIISFE